MKVVHILWSFTTGGTECRLIDQLNHLAGSIDQSLIIINNNYEEKLLRKIDKRVNVICIDRPARNKNPLFYIKLNFKIKSIKPDVVVSHVASIARILIIRKYSLLLHLHGLKEDLKKVINSYDGYISISKDVSLYIKSYKENASPILVYNGIDVRRFLNKSSVNEGCFKIVSVGRLCDEVKGQSILLNAISYLMNEYGFDDFKVFFIGDGPSRGCLESHAKKLKVWDKVQFLGNKSAEYLYDNLKNYDLAVLSSYREGLGNTIIEAMAAKVPVLVSDLPGPMEVIESGKYGDWFICGDYISCSEKILQVYKRTRGGLTNTFVEDAYSRVLEKFDIGVMARHLLGIYESFHQLKK